MNATDPIVRPEGFDRWDPATWPTYSPEHREAVLNLADAMGEEGACRYEGSGFDWDSFYSKLEGYLHLNLPSTTEDPIFSAIQRKARRAWKEANG